jgi:hypothetical protein
MLFVEVLRFAVLHQRDKASVENAEFWIVKSVMCVCCGHSEKKAMLWNK